MPPRIIVAGAPGAAVPADDRGLLYGDGLFETIAVRQGRLRFVDRHLGRLRHGCGRLAIPYDDAVVREALAMAAGGLAHGTVRLVLTRGGGQRGYCPPPAPEPLVIGYAYPDDRSGMGVMPLRVRICDTPVVEHPVLGGLKTLERLAHVMARAEWRDPGIGEGLMRDASGGFVCGTASNLFAIRAGEVVTPPIVTAGVRGIMRGIVMEAASAAGLAVREERIDTAMLQSADEVFLTSALAGIAPVAELAGRRFDRGPVTAKLRAFLAALGIEECAAAY